MKRILVLTLFVFPALVFQSDAVAQKKNRPLQRLQKNWDEIRPRGTLLKQIFGDDDDKQQSGSQSRQQPTPAVRPQVTPTQNASHRAPSPAPRSSAGRERLGVKVTESGERLTIVDVDARGAGHAAGLQRGDIIVTVGGIEIVSAEELGEILKIMGAGDQIEFEILRRGKRETLLVQFGDAPKSQARQFNPNAPTFTLSDQVEPRTPVAFETQEPPPLSRNQSRRRSPNSVLTDEFSKVSGRWQIEPPRNPRNVLRNPADHNAPRRLPSPVNSSEGPTIESPK